MRNKNRKLSLIQLISNSFRLRKSGSVSLPIALALVIIGTMMITVNLINASSSKQKASTSQMSAQAREASESGLTDIQSFFRENPSLLTLSVTSTDASNWTKVSKVEENLDDYLNDNPAFVTNNNASDITACADLNQQTKSSNFNNATEIAKKARAFTDRKLNLKWKSLDNSDYNYKLYRYTYEANADSNKAGKGKVIIGGRKNQDNNFQAESYIAVDFPVQLESIDVSAFPSVNNQGIGVWVKAASVSDKINTNVMVTCSDSGEIWSWKDKIASSHKQNNKFFAFTNVLDNLLSQTFEAFFGKAAWAKNNMASDEYFNLMGNKIIATNLPMPETPDSPDKYTPLHSNFSGTLPRSGDYYVTRKDKNGNEYREYIYQINSLENDTRLNVNTTSISDRTSLKGDVYDKVTVFVNGDIDLADGDYIKNSCLPEPIISSTGDLEYPTPTGNCNELQLKIIGKSSSGTFTKTSNSSVCSAFIWASTYDVVNEGGDKISSCYDTLTGDLAPNNRGIYWVNSWQSKHEDNNLEHYGSGVTTANFFAQTQPIPRFGFPESFQSVSKTEAEK